MSAPPAVLHVSEASFMRAVLDLARRSGWRCAHFADSRRQIAPGRHVGDRDAAGWPDLVLCRPPILLVVELKAEKGHLSDTQRDWLQALDMCGVNVAVWRPSAWDEIKRVLGGVAA